MAWIALEFHGTGDRFFGGTADDRVLGNGGAFLTGAGWSPRDYARFGTKAEAMTAAEVATNRRAGGKLAAIEEAPRRGPGRAAIRRGPGRAAIRRGPGRAAIRRGPGRAE